MTIELTLLEYTAMNFGILAALLTNVMQSVKINRLKKSNRKELNRLWKINLIERN